MKNSHLFVSAFSLAVLLVCSAFHSKPPETCTHPSWGFYGHKKINEMAIYTLPEGMFGFYKANLEYIVEHSVDPDKRRVAVKGEEENHFIDMDRYCTGSPCNPFDNVPRRWNDAVEKFGEDTLRANGIVPWHVNLMLIRLTEAFKQKDVNRILRLSAEIGHYIGDAHVPLHSTSNYNGQYTNQRGIHGFWESRLPEIFEPNYDFFVGKANYLDRPLDFIWDRVAESFAAVDSVLVFERELTASFPSDQKYSFEQRGAAEIKAYSREFSDSYHRGLNGQVERRMKQAVASIGSFWFTAWVNAGQPDMNPLISAHLKQVSEDSLLMEESAGKKLRVRDHE